MKRAIGVVSLMVLVLLSGAHGVRAQQIDTAQALPSVPSASDGAGGLANPDAVGLPPVTAVGVYGGYPSVAGAHFTVPVDGVAAFRSGLTAFPGLGVLWTPGLEIRFGQTPGTISSSSVYSFANLFVGRSHFGKERTHRGLEAGLGYRWIVPDRRATRWIGGLEAGMHWSPKSAFPNLPSIRAYWMIATP